MLGLGVALLSGLMRAGMIGKKKPNGTPGAEPTQPKTPTKAPRQVPEGNSMPANPQPRQPQPRQQQPTRDIDRQQSETAAEAERIRRRNAERRAANAARRHK